MSAGTVIEMRKTARFTHTIYQSELEQLLALSAEFSRAREAYIELRDYIRVAIESGAQVEAGFHTAALVDIEGGERISVVKPFKKLVVR